MEKEVGTRIMDAQIWISKLSSYHARKLCKKYYPAGTVRNLSLFHWCNIYETEFDVKLQPMSGDTIPTDYMVVTKKNVDEIETRLSLIN